MPVCAGALSTSLPKVAKPNDLLPSLETRTLLPTATSLCLHVPSPAAISPFGAQIRVHRRHCRGSIHFVPQLGHVISTQPVMHTFCTVHRA